MRVTSADWLDGFIRGKGDVDSTQAVGASGAGRCGVVCAHLGTDQRQSLLAGDTDVDRLHAHVDYDALAG